MKSVSKETEFKSNIKSWYAANYDDELTEQLNPDLTFKALWDAMCEGFDVYDTLGVSDSLVRERVFERLAALLNVDYNVVYYTWLNEYNKALNSLGVK